MYYLQKNLGRTGKSSKLGSHLDTEHYAALTLVSASEGEISRLVSKGAEDKTASIPRKNVLHRYIQYESYILLII